MQPGTCRRLHELLAGCLGFQVTAAGRIKTRGMSVGAKGILGLPLSFHLRVVALLVTLSLMITLREALGVALWQPL